jgi:carboxyl-terminal processing protease
MDPLQDPGLPAHRSSAAIDDEAGPRVDQLAGDAAGPSSRGGMAIAAGVLVVVSAVAIFAAGLLLGGGGLGRDAEEQRAVEAFVETWRRIDDQYVGVSDPAERLEGAIRGMFETLDDPYSGYLDPEEFASTFADIRGELEGIGAVMGIEDAGGGACAVIEGPCQLRVIEVLPGTPALAAGLRAGDVVWAVDGEVLEGLRLEDAVLRIRGPRDSAVLLTVRRAADDLDMEVTRSVIRSQDVRTARLEDGRVGYLRVDSFSSDVAQDFRVALRAHLDAGVRDLVLDLRDDPGGFVDAAVDIASQFIADGPVYWEEDASGTRRAVEAAEGGLATDPAIGLVVLVDGGTASASEIVAGALQDAQRGTLVGLPTFGKGTVQEWTRLPDDQGGFRLSIAKWLTRDQGWVHEVGLHPDIEVAADPSERFRPSAGDDADAALLAQAAASDPQLQRAVALLLESASSVGVSPAAPGESIGSSPRAELAVPSTATPVPSAAP